MGQLPCVLASGKFGIRANSEEISILEEERWLVGRSVKQATKNDSGRHSYQYLKLLKPDSLKHCKLRQPAQVCAMSERSGAVSNRGMANN